MYRTVIKVILCNEVIYSLRAILKYAKVLTNVMYFGIFYHCNKSVSMSNSSNNLLQDLFGRSSSACPMKSSSWLFI